MFCLNYLIDRDREEKLRVSGRDLIFAGGETHHIETYRMVWDWFDRLIGYEHGFSEAEIHKMIPRCAKEEGLSLNDATARVVEHLVAKLDHLGIDITDDNLQLDVARVQMAKWRNRKNECGNSGQAQG